MPDIFSTVWVIHVCLGGGGGGGGGSYYNYIILLQLSFCLSDTHTGFGYDSNTIQDFRVACPSGTILHLAVQDSSLPEPDALNNCDESVYLLSITRVTILPQYIIILILHL